MSYHSSWFKAPRPKTRTRCQRKNELWLGLFFLLFIFFFILPVFLAGNNSQTSVPHFAARSFPSFPFSLYFNLLFSCCFHFPYFAAKQQGSPFFGTRFNNANGTYDVLAWADMMNTYRNIDTESWQDYHGALYDALDQARSARESAK